MNTHELRGERQASVISRQIDTSFSSGSWILRPFPQPVHIAHGRDTEKAFVLAIEVGGVVVAHPIGRTGRVEVFAQHQSARLLWEKDLRTR